MAEDRVTLESDRVRDTIRRSLEKKQQQADMMDMMQLAVRETIKNELTLHAEEYHDGSVELQLMLGEDAVGKPFYLSLDSDTDHRHNFDHITDVCLKVE